MSAQDGFGVAEGGVGSQDSLEGDGGNDGADNGSWSLSTGGIVGISVGIAVVIIAIGQSSHVISSWKHTDNVIKASMWFLWYMAKKRQWKIRESIKRASRRLTGRKVPPRTPRAAPSSSHANRRGTVYAKPSAAPRTQQKEIDLERGMEQKSQKPSPGWLANEKERSRSRSPDGELKDGHSQGGFMTKFGFGKR
jgi:hypothetical protein